MKSVPTFPRRQFLQRAAIALAVGGLWSRTRLAAIEPIRRPGRPRLKLSLAAYSFREFFNHADASRRITLLNFIDYCAEHGCDGAELTSYYFPKDFGPDFIPELKRRAFLRGVDITGTAVGNNFALPEGPAREQQIAQVKRWIGHAAELGAPHIRVFAGDSRELDKPTAKQQCVRALEECAGLAARHGVFLGLENHGGIVADVSDLLDIIKAVQSPWIGVNLDTGNFYGDVDPYQEMARLAPYAVNVQFKVAVNQRGRGKVPIDLARVVKILRDANYQGYVALEYEEKDPWGEVPGWLQRLREAFAAA